ncbi:TRAP transporter substrate-binding protein (plasmid) [Geminicoccaceae bacterium 1502E]|nr:TRAP transporter substrate-binding protein [Geminicoccaceae bacterium 1502E]
MRSHLVSAVLVTALAASGSAAAADYTLKLGHANDPDPKNSIFHAMSLEFERLVEERSGGRIDVVIYPAMQLGGEQEQVRATQLGTQEAALVSMNNLNAFAPSLGFFSLPYMFTSVEEGRRAIDRGWEQINEWAVADAGVRVLTITDAGFRVLSNSRHPVRSLEDLQDLKIRLPQNPIMISAFESWGVSPIPMAWSETFNALQQKVVDGQENPVNVLLAVKFYEVQKYVTDIDWILQTGALVVSEDFFQGLPEELQAAVVEAGKETMAWERAYVEKVISSDVARLEELGIEFAGRPADFETWVERARATWADQYAFLGKGDAAAGKAIVETIQGLTGE